MSKPDNGKGNGGGGGGQAAGAGKKGRTFVVKKAGVVNGHVTGGLVIRDGVAETDDAIRAHACLESGCEVTDKATGKPAFANEDAEADAAKK